MPALPNVLQTLKVTQHWQLPSNGTSLSRFYITYTGTPPTAAQATTFAGAVRGALGSDLASVMPVGTFTTNCEVEDLDSTDGAVGFSTGSTAGTRMGGVLAPGSCLVINFLIARRYRGGKPKIFLPLGVSTDVTGSGFWNNTFAAAALSGWGTALGTILGSGWTGAGTLTHSNVSYYSGFTVVTNPITHRARNVPTLRGTPVVDHVNAYDALLTIGSQRRRNL